MLLAGGKRILLRRMEEFGWQACCKEMIGVLSILAGFWQKGGLQCCCVDNSALSSLSMWYFSASGCSDLCLLSGSTRARSPASSPNGFGFSGLAECSK